MAMGHDVGKDPFLVFGILLPIIGVFVPDFWGPTGAVIGFALIILGVISAIVWMIPWNRD